MGAFFKLSLLTARVVYKFRWRMSVCLSVCP